MFSGDGGEDAAIRSNFHTYVTYYLQSGYQIVEVAWGPLSGGIAWEIANPLVPGSLPSILYAACRPASFLNWVRNGAPGQVGQGIWKTTQGGMCAHGDSGGAGALGYVTFLNGTDVGETERAGPTILGVSQSTHARHMCCPEPRNRRECVWRNLLTAARSWRDISISLKMAWDSRQSGSEPEQNRSEGRWIA